MSVTVKEKEKEKVQSYAQKAKAAVLRRAINRANNPPPEFLSDASKASLHTLTFTKEFNVSELNYDKSKSAQKTYPNGLQILEQIKLCTKWAEDFIVSQLYALQIMSMDCFHLIFFDQQRTKEILSIVPFINLNANSRFVGKQAEPGFYDSNPVRSVRVTIHDLPLTVSDADVIKAMENYGVLHNSTVYREDYSGQYQGIMSGTRFIFMTSMNEPDLGVDPVIEIGGYKVKTYHYKQVRIWADRKKLMKSRIQMEGHEKNSPSAEVLSIQNKITKLKQTLAAGTNTKIPVASSVSPHPRGNCTDDNGFLPRSKGKPTSKTVSSGSSSITDLPLVKNRFKLPDHVNPMDVSNPLSVSPRERRNDLRHDQTHSVPKLRSPPKPGRSAPQTKRDTKTSTPEDHQVSRSTAVDENDTSRSLFTMHVQIPETLVPIPDDNEGPDETTDSTGVHGVYHEKNNDTSSPPRDAEPQSAMAEATATEMLAASPIKRTTLSAEDTARKSLPSTETSPVSTVESSGPPPYPDHDPSLEKGPAGATSQTVLPEKEGILSRIDPVFQFMGSPHNASPRTHEIDFTNESFEAVGSPVTPSKASQKHKKRIKLKNTLTLLEMQAFRLSTVPRSDPASSTPPRVETPKRKGSKEEKKESKKADQKSTPPKTEDETVGNDPTSSAYL